MPIEKWNELHTKERLCSLFSKYAGKGSDTDLIASNQAHNLTVGELFNLLETSLNVQRDELTRARKELRKSLKTISEISQYPLL